MTTPALVIFDCDGVLVDTERLTVDVEARLLTELGLPHTADQVVARWMGRSSAAQLAELEAELGAAATARFDRRIGEELAQSFARDLRAIDGVSDVVDRLESAGVPTCVASSGTHARMRETLGLTGLWDRFEGRIFSATEVEHGKPAPDLFLHAAHTMGAAPELCAVVEDSAYGVQAAVSAGMRALGFVGGLAPAGSLEAAGAEPFAEMRELPDLLHLP